MNKFNVYFHKDFDGICSAAIFSEVVSSYNLVETKEFNYIPVDYHLKDTWLTQPLLRPNAVLDFLFHQDAEWWYDHHVSTFLTPEVKKKYKKNSVRQFWNTEFQSCPALINTHFLKHWTLFSGTLERFADWITWSNKIDSALYDSPKEIIELEHPCLQIYASLGKDSSDSFLTFLINSIRELSPDELAKKDEIQEKYRAVKSEQNKIIGELKGEFKYSNGIVFLDQTQYNYPFQRYLSYYFYPDAQYTVGIFKKNAKTFSISLGKNPWKDFKNKNLGKLSEKYGGGGRPTVGGILCDDYSQSIEIAQKIMKFLSKP